jgi:hypothetical protein
MIESAAMASPAYSMVTPCSARTSAQGRPPATAGRSRRVIVQALTAGTSGGGQVEAEAGGVPQVDPHAPGNLDLFDDALGRRYSSRRVGGGRRAGQHARRLYCDHVLVKEPEMDAATSWHHDLQAWPIEGRQIASLWPESTWTPIRRVHCSGRGSGLRGWD